MKPTHRLEKWSNTQKWMLYKLSCESNRKYIWNRNDKERCNSTVNDDDNNSSSSSSSSECYHNHSSIDNTFSNRNLMCGVFRKHFQYMTISNQAIYHIRMEMRIQIQTRMWTYERQRFGRKFECSAEHEAEGIYWHLFSRYFTFLGMKNPEFIVQRFRLDSKWNRIYTRVKKESLDLIIPISLNFTR